MSLLTPDLLNRVVSTGVKVGLPALRGALVAVLPADVQAALPINPIPFAQLQLDVATLAALPEVPGVEHPLRTWLQNAHALTGANFPEADVLLVVDEEVRKALATAAVVAATPDDPFAAFWIYDALAVLDRTELRNHLKRLRAGARPTTLIVRGPSGSGRTRVSELVQAYGQARGEHVGVLVDAGRLTPLDLVLELEVAIAPAGAPRAGPMSDPPKVTEVVALVVSWLKARGGLTWLVVDDLEDASQWTNDLLAGLVDKLSAGGNSSLCRFVLLGLADDPKTSQQAVLLREQLTHESVQREHVLDFVRWLYEVRLGRQVLEAELDATVARILPPPEQTGAPYLKALGEQAELVATGLLNGLGGG